MRNPGASVESPSLPDADQIAVAWTDLSKGGVALRPDKAKSLSGVMLALGAALLLFVPISGVFFLVAGGLGLAISSGAPQLSSPTD